MQWKFYLDISKNVVGDDESLLRLLSFIENQEIAFERINLDHVKVERYQLNRLEFGVTMLGCLQRMYSLLSLDLRGWLFEGEEEIRILIEILEESYNLEQINLDFRQMELVCQYCKDNQISQLARCYQLVSEQVNK